MKKNRLIKHIVCILLGLSAMSFIQAQSSITIDASQQITNFVFTDGDGLQDNTYLMFGGDNLYKSSFSSAYSVGYSYLLDYGLFFKSSIGMRHAGATMVYDAVNYQWNLQYLKLQLGAGYAYDLGLFAPYIAVSGYYGSLVKANQCINNENFDIIDSETIKPNDYGLNIPIGVRIDASDYISIYTEMSYLIGLQNIENTSSAQVANNVAYMFTLGLSFTIE